jgi:hypothetical protein
MQRVSTIALISLLLGALTSAQASAKPRQPFVQLPDDTPQQAPKDFQFLPAEWGPVSREHPRYPVKMLRQAESGYVLAWIRFGSDGCPQRIEIPDQAARKEFVLVSMSTFLSMRAVIPEGATGPWWHLSWTGFRVGEGREPEWLRKLQALSPPALSDAELRRFKHEHWAQLRRKCPDVEVLIEPQRKR